MHTHTYIYIYIYIYINQSIKSHPTTTRRACGVDSHGAQAQARRRGGPNAVCKPEGRAEGRKGGKGHRSTRSKNTHLMCKARGIVKERLWPLGGKGRGGRREKCIQGQRRIHTHTHTHKMSNPHTPLLRNTGSEQATHTHAHALAHAHASGK